MASSLSSTPVPVAAEARDWAGECVASLAAAQARLALEPLARTLTSLPRWQRFMRLHVFAVWDFMSLLKRLQVELNPPALPWRPGAGGEGARLINEIVLAEETDEDGRGGFCSHFDTYRAAMREAEADAAPIEAVLADVAAGMAPGAALARATVPREVRTFVAGTLETALSAPVHAVAASFLFGREAVLPALFADLLAALEGHAPGLGLLHHYFARHIEVDGDDHRPKALRLLSGLCGNEPARWREARAVAEQSLERRAALWRAIEADVALAAP